MKKNIRGILISDNLSFANTLVKPLALVNIILQREPTFSLHLNPELLRGKVDFILFNFDFNLTYYNHFVNTLRKEVPNIPFFVMSDELTESRMVEIIRLGYVGVFTSAQIERLAEVVHRTLEWERIADRELNFSTTDFESIFNQLPEPIFLEDFSFLKEEIDRLRGKGITDFSEYFSSHTQEVIKITNSTVIVAANQAALNYTDTATTHDIFRLDKIIRSDGTIREFIEEYTRLANGETDFSISGEDFRGGFHIVELKVVKGHEKDLRRVMVSIKNITTLVESQKEIQNKENMLRGLVERTPSIFYTEKAYGSGKLIYISPQIYQLTGYTQDEWLASDNLWKVVMHPDDCEGVSSITEEDMEVGAPVRVDFRIITKDGRTIWVRDTFQVINGDDGKPEFWQGAIYDVTKEKLAELALVESEKKLTRLMGNLPGMVYRTQLNNSNSIDFLSDGCLQLTGYNASELMSVSRADSRKLLGIDMPDEMLEPQVEAADASGYYELVYQIKTKNGETKWIMDRGQAVRNSRDEVESLEGIMIDITEQRLAEEKVREFSEELEELYQNSAFISSLLDPVKAANQVVEMLGEQSNWDVIGFNLFDETTQTMNVTAHKISSALPNYFDRVKQFQKDKKLGGTMWSFTHKKVIRSGDVRTVPNYFAVDPAIKSCLYVPLIASDICMGTIAIESMTPNAFNENDEKLLTILSNQVAITIINAHLLETATIEIEARSKIEQQLLAEQQTLEQIVAARTEELQNANSELEKSSQLKSEFMAAISHELRTPLTGILGLSEVLGNQSFGPLSEKQINSIKLITDNGRRLLYMINDILDYTRLEANQMQLSIGMVSINYLISNVANSYKQLAEPKNISIHTHLPKEDLMIECDSKKVKQMLSNLMSNAIKFTPDGGIITLDLKANQKNECVIISVTDTGIGINPNDVKNLFKPFIQLDSRLERSYNGAGLGLVLVSKLVELHKGSVSVESSPGKGSSFSFVLPKKQK